MSVEVDLLFKTMFPEHADPTDAPGLSADAPELARLDDMPPNAVVDHMRAERAEKENVFYPFYQAHEPAAMKAEAPLTKTQQEAVDRGTVLIIERNKAIFEAKLEERIAALEKGAQ